MPGRYLVYTWIANWNDKPDAKTVVTWELVAIPGGTRVKVTHSGLSNEPVVRDAYRGGWPGVISNLKKFVEE